MMMILVWFGLLEGYVELQCLLGHSFYSCFTECSRSTFCVVPELVRSPCGLQHLKMFPLTWCQYCKEGTIFRINAEWNRLTGGEDPEEGIKRKKRFPVVYLNDFVSDVFSRLLA